MNPYDYDLIIVGGGMAGSSLAIALSGQGLRIGLVESAPFEVDSVPNYDDRAIALAYGSCRILQTLKVWPGLADNATPIRHIHVSEQGGFGFTRLDAHKEGVDHLGQVATSRDIGIALLGRLQECGDVTQISPARVTDFELGEQQATLSLETPEGSRQLHCRLIVAADGGNSFFRERLQIPTRRWGYGQNAVIANITTDKPHDHRAFERFTPDGPVALLPMTEGRCGLVWTVPDEQLDEVMALDDAAFIARLQRHFGWRLGRIRKAGARAAYPLVHIRAMESVRQRAAIIGNAAHTLHPIAGQGFNLGIRDVAALAETLIDTWHQGGDIGSHGTLQRYEQWRQADQQGVATATDTLARLYTNPLLAVMYARNLGMLALDALPFAKHRLADAAMGLHGRLPRLTRGAGLEETKHG